LIKGSIVALITPFKSDGKIDFEAYEKLIEFQIKNGTDAILVAGSTGEGVTLEIDEAIDLLALAVEKTNGRVPIIMNVGKSSTALTCKFATLAVKAGANYVMAVVPPYNKPTHQGLIEHFSTIARTIKDTPLIVYNVPGRTGKDIDTQTVIALSEIKNIVAIKEASGNLIKMTKIIKETTLGSRPDFSLLSGDDPLTFPIMTIGGKGVISVTANIVPERIKSLVDAAIKKDYTTALNLHCKLLELHEAMFMTTNPIPVKTALHMMGMIEENFRLPLVQMSHNEKLNLHKILKDYKIL